MSRIASIKKGTYCMASKYRDGDPGDPFAVGYYDGSFDHFGEMRHLVIDHDGKQFKANGFRRVARIGSKRGTWMVNHLAYIEEMRDRFSVWHWYRAPWRELRSIDAVTNNIESDLA